MELRDGALLGGFSNRALFKIFEREEGYQHPKLAAHLQRFRELGTIEP